MANVERTKSLLGRREGLTTLEQRFRFTGERADVAHIVGLLLSAPLVGSDSIFGERPGEEGAPAETSRTLRGFSPAPGFRFDVVLSQRAEDVLVVEFSQPNRAVPYLHGGFVWAFSDHGDGAELDEQINTDMALQVAGEPLTGPKPSLRRWLFFRAGHKQVMRTATSNLAGLLDRQA